MVTLRKLSAEETEQAFPKRGQIDLTEYTDALNAMAPGESVAIEPNGITKRALKRRIGQAARSIGASVKWSRQADDNSMVFQLRELRKPRTRRVKSTNGAK